jgi:hypothetical protein
MSRAKKARARERRGPTKARGTPTPEERSRVRAATRRASAAKIGVAGLAIVGFGAACGFSRLYYPGHTKKPLQPLSAPPRYVKIVQQNLLQAGIVAPTQAPPGAATASS